MDGRRNRKPKLLSRSNYTPDLRHIVKSWVTVELPSKLRPRYNRLSGTRDNLSPDDWPVI